MALHTRFSQVSGNAPDMSLKNAWDISIFTQVDKTIPPELSYKVQVSTYRKEENYTPDIDMLSLCDDLELPDERNLNRHLIVGRIMMECAMELERGSPTLTARLDQRTEQLLDVLG
jgi:hypothetical protein